MRTPEHRAHPRAGKNFEVDLDMNYLGPGAFTVLPLDPGNLPDPPPAPPPYRLTPTTRRQKHKSFAIIGEPTSSSQNSRSSSPSGRVSPFKGRGFNPVGSRYASPSISPVPPEDPRAVSPRPGAGGNSSKIPKPTAGGKPRKSSTGAIFGEKVAHVNFHGLNRQSSQSLSSLEDGMLRKRPPPSPRKKLKGAAAFKQLSPIQGSSPEPSQSLSSPSRIPTKSRSTPPSRLASPTRDRSRGPTRSQSRPNVSRSRDQSPLKSPSRIPIKRYDHIRSKVNSFHRPKGSQNQPYSSDQSEDNESPKKKVLNRKNSLNRTSSRPNLLPKTFMGSKNHKNYTSDSSVSTDQVDSHKPSAVPPKPIGTKVMTKHVSNATSVGKSSNSAAKVSNSKPSASKTNQTPKRDDKNEPQSASTAPSVPKSVAVDNGTSSDTSQTDDTRKRTSVRGSKLDLSNLDLDDLIPSAIEVVSSTTSTVTKPLKIDTPKFDRSQAVSPMIDGRVLSATSVSHAINKMNDTVLNTQTLIKDSGLHSRLSPAATALSAIRSEMKKGENGDDSGKGGPKEGDRADLKDDFSKKVDNKADSKPGEVGTVPKTDGKTDSPNATTDKTAKANPNNVNNHSSNQTASQNNSKTTPSSVSVPAAINHSTNHISNNHSNNHMTTVGLGNARAIEREVQNNMNRLLGSMDSSLGGTPVGKLSANDRIREARTVIAADVKPIRITVREKPSDVDVQSGNVGPHFSIANGVNERPGLPPSHQPSPPPNESAKDEPPPNRCKRFLNSCTKALTCNKCQSCKRSPKVQESNEEDAKTGCFKCLSKKHGKKEKREQVRINIEDENGQGKKSFWEKLKCCKKNRVGDTQSCFSIGKRKQSWVERRTASFLESEIQQKTKCCSKLGCKNFFRKIFCCCCKKKEELPLSAVRKESMVSNKKKSLTPTSLPPPEDTKPKIDISLVEHTSHMKGAIPILPIWLAWFCCVMNCIGPGTGTVFSGLFCLCLGKPRFSQNDGPRPRIGSFVINLIIGFSQFFTVLFCLVGWGWSIWWGVIMIKVAKKHKKFKHLERLEEAAARPQALAGNQKRDVERGRM